MRVFTEKMCGRAGRRKTGDNTLAMRILVVEDEDRLARLIARVLTEEGYTVETETNGRLALVRALAGEFDLLIVDWMLPDLSGVHLVRRLRAAEVGTPAIILTARDQIEDRVEGLDAGADDYLPKPFAFPELLARVRALTRRPRAGEGDVYANVVDLYVSYLRKKLDRDGEPSHIRTVRGVGYTFDAPRAH